MNAKKWTNAGRWDGKRKVMACPNTYIWVCSSLQVGALLQGSAAKADGEVSETGASQVRGLQTAFFRSSSLTPLLHLGHIRISSQLMLTSSSNTSDKALTHCWGSQFLHLITLASKTVFLNASPEIFPFVASGPSTPSFTISRSFE